MEINLIGKIIYQGEIKSGVSKAKNTPWSSIEYVAEEISGKYPKKVAFTVFGNEKVQAATGKLAVGDVVTAFLDISCSEYQGRYFNQIQAWKLVKDNVDVFSGVATAAAQAQSNVNPVAATVPPNFDTEDGVPF